LVSVTHSRTHSAQLLTHALTRATLTLKRTNQHTLRHASSICTNSICTNSMHTNLAQMLYNRNYFAHGLSIGQHTHSLARYPTPTFTLTNTLLCTLSQYTRTIHPLIDKCYIYIYLYVYIFTYVNYIYIYIHTLICMYTYILNTNGS